MEKEKILIVEDDMITQKVVQHVLENYNFSVLKAQTGKEATKYLQSQQKINAVILDINLPDINGLDVLKEIRNHPTHQDIPILVLTSNSDKLDAILALEMGADDYITKPFHKRELIARLNVGIRRSKPSSATIKNGLKFGKLEINIENREVNMDGLPIDLTFKEFELLLFLTANPGKVFSRDELLTRLWSDMYIAETRSIDMHISSLRKKLGDNPRDNQYIETVRGVGYRFRK